MKHTGALKVALALGICLTALGAKAAGEDAASYTYPAPAPPPTEHGEFSDKRFYGSWQVSNTTTYVFRPGHIVHIDYLFERNRDVRPKDYDEYLVILREFENRVILKVWDAKETLLPHEKITYRIYVLTLRPLSGIWKGSDYYPFEMLVEGVGCWGKGWYLPHTAPVKDQWQQLRSFKSGCRFDEKGNLDIEDSNHIFHVAHSTDSQLARKWEKWERSEIPADPPPVLDPSLQAIQQTVFLDDWLFDDQINVPGIWHFLPGNIRRVSYPFGTHDYSLSDLATIHYQVINEAPGRVLLRTWSREPTDDSQGGFQSDRLFSFISLELDPQDLKVGERYFYNSSGHKIRYRYCYYVEKDFPYPFGADPKQQFVEIFRRIGDGGTICNISTAGIIGKEYEWVFHPGGERSPIGIPMDMP